MRSLAVVFLCLCLAMSGTATAMPRFGMVMEATMGATAMTPDCPGGAAVAGMPAADGGAGSVDEKKPDCCRVGGCGCAVAHGVILAFSALAPARSEPLATTLVPLQASDYASPALARLIRPPIS